MNGSPEPTDPLSALSEGEVRIVPSDYSLKKIIGEDVDIKQVFSPENIAKAQQKIDAHKDAFLQWVKKDIDTLEDNYARAQANLAECGPAIKALAHAAFVIKSQAGTFGYGLASVVAKSLDDFCTRYFKPEPAHMTVIRKHIDTISHIFTAKLTGDGGPTGVALTHALLQLVEKYSK